MLSYNRMALKIEKNVLLARFTTFHIGGPAKFLARVKSAEDLEEAVEFAKNNKLKFLILGNGSKFLFSDDGFDGLVIKMEIKGIEFADEGKNVLVSAGAGENWDDLVGKTVDRGLYGLENLSLIPGSVGAAPVQNVGAYGEEARNTIEWVEVFDPAKMETKKLSREECMLGYRESIFKKPEGRNLIITRVAFRLSKTGKLNSEYKDVKAYFENLPAQTGNKAELNLQNLRKAIIEIRKNKFPGSPETGTAGSFFKNVVVSKEDYGKLAAKFPGIPAFPDPGGKVSVPTGWMIENIAKMKGKRKGDAGVWDKQALILVNYGKATSSDIKKLAEEIKDSIREKTGIELEPETIYA